MTEELLEMIEEAACSGFTLHLHFENSEWNAEYGEYIDELDADQLHAFIAELTENLTLLDRQEPKNIASDAYEAWADSHEYLEDILDECRERLDRLGN